MARAIWTLSYFRLITCDHTMNTDVKLQQGLCCKVEGLLGNVKGAMTSPAAEGGNVPVTFPALC